MKLQVRLALTVALAAAIAILVMAAAFWVLAARQPRSAIDDGLLAVVNQPRQFVGETAVGRRGDLRDDGDRRGQRGLGQIFGDISAADRRLFTLVRFTFDGEVIVDEGLPSAVLEDPDTPTISTVEVDGERYRMAVASVEAPRGEAILQVASNIEDLEAGLGRLRRQILLGSIAGIALAGGMGALVARRLTSPITEVSEAAKAMAVRRDLPSRIDVKRSDEIGDLARSFNEMLGALELSRDQQHRLVADASHELRTPLTSLRLKLELLDSTAEIPQTQQRELLASSAAEVEQLSHLVNELVDLATDPTGVDESVVLYSLPALVSEVVETIETRSGRTINIVAGDGQPDVAIRHRMVRRAVSNLVDNAIKYSGPDAAVTVRVDSGRVEVRDGGEGIPEADLPYVFDRFFRSPTARTRPGNGIGLAIVQRVAEMHGGETWVSNATDPSGAIVGFSVGSTPAR